MSSILGVSWRCFSESGLRFSSILSINSQSTMGKSPLQAATQRIQLYGMYALRERGVGIWAESGQNLYYSLT